MPYITDITADGELNAAVQNFSTVCSANSAALGLTPANLLEISTAAASFGTNVNSATAAKATAKAVVEAKDLQKKTTRAVISKYGKTFRANAAVTDNLLEQLMLPHHKTPGTKSAPTIPTSVVASADGDGLVKLSWNRNGNVYGTQFLIESRNDPAANWTLIGGTTQAKFENQATPGSYVAYRVSAQRRSVTSAASTPVVLWDNSSSSSLRIAA